MGNLVPKLHRNDSVLCQTCLGITSWLVFCGYGTYRGKSAREII